MKKRTLISVMAIALTCFCLIGTTFAWLVAKTEPIVNTFTSGNINVSLSESTSRNPKIVPGATLTENPQAIVRKNSEDCWLFVKIQKSETFDEFLSFEIADRWTLLAEGSGVYYRVVTMSTEDQTFGILKGNVVTAKTTPTKERYDTIDQNHYPKLTFTAYAVQKLGFETPEAAWVEAEQLVQQ